ncbi:MAG: nuclear transport factor 2 family protein [Hyphomonadaceae bacterium]
MRSAYLIGSALLLVLSGCDEPSPAVPASSPPAPAAAAVSYLPVPQPMPAKADPLVALTGSDAVARISPALNADELAHAKAAVSRLPAGAKVFHLIADGSLVMAHYVVEGSADPGVMASVFQFSSGQKVDREELILFRGWDPARSGVGEAWTAPTNSDDALEAENKAIVQRFMEGISKADSLESTIASTVAADFVDHTRPEGPGQEALARAIASDGIGKTVASIKELAGLGDIVMAVSTITNTAADGAKSFSPGADVFRIKSGRISERWRINY